LVKERACDPEQTNDINSETLVGRTEEVKLFASGSELSGVTKWRRAL
jgi:hypothetical protein